MKIPLSFYRIQFNPEFGFAKASEVVEYLSFLGISDLYASPIFKAGKGSAHGYDVVDQNQLNPELGNRAAFERLSASLKDRRMGWVQDIVPNHMAMTGENRVLMDVLENSGCSDYFDFFDIEWNHPDESMKGRLLAPFLGRPYGDALEDGEIQLTFAPGGFCINYGGLELPVRIGSYLKIIAPGVDSLKGSLGEDHPDFIKFLGTYHSLNNLSSTDRCAERNEQILFVKRMLWELYLQNPRIKEFIEERIATFNGKKGVPESFNPLDGLLSEQNFRLSFWKVAAEEINYRRFFNINELISLRVEDEKVFSRVHSLLLDLVRDNTVTGLRIDHIDGLYDPTAYLRRLRERTGEDLYVVVEKILSPGETLPDFWPVQGTTGSDFLKAANGIFCREKNERAFEKIYSGFTGLRTAYDDVLYEKRKLIAEKYMIGDADNIAHLFKRILSKDRHGSDLTIYGLKKAFIEILVLFPVYRTYISRDLSRSSDPSFIREAAQKARGRNPDLLQEINFIEKVLLLQFGDYLSEKDKEDWLHFVMRFQQFTGPNMAKGLEDTTLYVYSRLLSLNEVGGNPGEFGTSLEAFHAMNRMRASISPYAMNASSTHDTKRGEDARARIHVLSEIPLEWEKRIKAWNRMNRKRKKRLDHKEVPDRNDEYFLYQTLIGAFPPDETEYAVFVERMKSAIVKSIREAKVHTAWLKPDSAYEDAFVAFIEEILTPSGRNEFLREFIPFQRKVAYYGMFNSLSQTLIKMTSPGIPDFYQGSELWDLNLVDPDNRRPVDFERRKECLSNVADRSRRDMSQLLSDLLLHWEDGRIKLFLIFRVLKARREHADLFQKGDYLPLSASGRFADHLVAFARKRENAWAVTLCPRFLTEVTGEGESPLGPDAWSDTRVPIPEEAPVLWREAITGREIKGGRAFTIGEILKDYPAALLISL